MQKIPTKPYLIYPISLIRFHLFLIKRSKLLRDDYMAMIGPTRPYPSLWTRIEDKIFELALVLFPEEMPDRWEKIAAELPGKDVSEVREHYEVLLHDVLAIDSGLVEVPSYSENSFTPEWVENRASQISFSGEKARAAAESQRKKGVPWTAEEHRLFLDGLQKYGKGDWRSISRNAVVSRTPTQVASHAQKYYLRLNAVKKEKKRSSIHDITPNQSDQVARPKRQRLDPDPALGAVHQTMAPPKVSNLSQGQAMGAPYLGQFRERGSSR